MKRLFLIIALLYSSLSVYSQTTTGYINNNTNYSTSKSSRGEDTLFMGMGVEYRDPRYIYGSNWVDECIFNSKNRGIEAGYGSSGRPGKIARRIYTDTSLSIIGLAVAATTGIKESIRMDIEAGIYTLDQCYADTSMANRLPEYVQLYEATDTSFDLVAQGRWDDPNNKPVKKLELIDKPSYGSIKHIYAPIYEVYFDSPVVVNDSFYVGVTNFNNVLEIDGYTPTGLPRWNRWKYLSTMYYATGKQYPNDPDGCYSVGYYKLKYDPMEPGGPCYYETTGFIGIDTTIWINVDFNIGYKPIIFPIIDTTGYYLLHPDTCADVSNFGLVRTSTSYATFSWDGEDGHTSWEMAYGTEGTLPENCTVVGTPHTVHCITHLDSGQWYVAYVRAVCDSNLYSRWSDSIRFYIAGDTTRNNDIIIPNTILEENTHILPNPAKSIVNIFSSFAMSKIEVFSLNGVKVKEEAASGIATEIDVSLLPKGTYIVKVHTSWGIAMKKLIVN
jgi:hypothetical protein